MQEDAHKVDRQAEEEEKKKMAEAYWMFDGHPRKFREIVSRRKKKKGERCCCCCRCVSMYCFCCCSGGGTLDAGEWPAPFSALLVILTPLLAESTHRLAQTQQPSSAKYIIACTSPLPLHPCRL
jgi:hypothetical protein